MLDLIQKWKDTADAIAAKVVAGDQTATADDLRAIALVAALVLVAEQLSYITWHYEMAGSGI